MIATAPEAGWAEVVRQALDRLSPAAVRVGTDVAAAAGYRAWPGNTAHLSVLIAPQHRGRGLARVVASMAVTEALDLAAYLGIADELSADRVLDVGCGTGCLALLLAATGRTVVAVDPAEASLGSMQIWR